MRSASDRPVPKTSIQTIPRRYPHLRAGQSKLIVVAIFHVCFSKVNLFDSEPLENAYHTAREILVVGCWPLTPNNYRQSVRTPSRIVRNSCSLVQPGPNSSAYRYSSTYENTN
jgi:hypothetical protein